MNALSHLPFSFAHFIFHLTARETIELPEDKGSTFRGGFGHTLKEVWCQRPDGRLCDNCRRKELCAYSYIFETPKAFGGLSELHANNLPHPFVLLPPLQSQNLIQPGESLSFRLTLFGSAIHLVESFVVAFDKLGEIGIGRGQGRFRLERVTNEDGSVVYDVRSRASAGQVCIRNFEEFELAASRFDQPTLELKFLTPTHLLHHGRFVPVPSFEIFLRRLLGRASELAKVHCGKEWTLDYHALIDTAAAEVRFVHHNLREQDWERYSNRQKQRMKFRGLVGEIAYAGNFKPYLPLILLGQYLHVGNKTSFGMGKYEIK